MTLHDKALRIKAIVLDIDGVLTDGRIGYGCGSMEEIKFFHVRDGHGSHTDIPSLPDIS